jgi:Septum formation
VNLMIRPRAIALIAAAVLGISACGSPDESPLPSGEPSVPASSIGTDGASELPASSGGDGSGETVSVFDVAVGDCFNAPDADTLSEVDLVDCADPHQYEAYHAEDHPAAGDEAFIGDEAMTDYADDLCLREFEGFVGIAWEESALNYFYLQPTAETWDIGDREILCAVFSEEGDLTGSAEGTEQ